MSEFVFVGTYEVREVRKGWQHPKDARGRYVPLLPFGSSSDGEEPAPAALMMPAPLGEVEIAAYEAVSEGTPASPSFPDTPQGRLDLCNWCAEHVDVMGRRRVDAEAWAAILFGEAAITGDGV